MSFIELNETFWVGASFFAFVGFLWKMGVFSIVGNTLTNRAESIKLELDEARKLKEEAQAILASFQRKQRKAENEAQEIIDHAKREAELLLKEAEKRLQEEVEIRTDIAKQKIAQEESLVIQQIRENAVDITINAARTLILENMDKNDSDRILELAADDLERKFH